MLVKFGRFQKEGSIFYGIVEGDEVYEIGTPERVHKLSELRPLCPIIPTKVVAVGLNYKDHAEELGLSLPDEPLIFLKPTSALVGPEDAIILPPESREVHYEGELAVIIGKELYRPRTYKQVEEAILGYTCFNDVTARDLQRKDGQWTRAKSFNTFAPCGPYIVKGLDLGSQRIITRVNGEVKQSSTTENLIFNVFKLVKFIANIMTLYPGDIIATGTPPGVGPLKAGDVVEVEIQDIGVLRNYVVDYKGKAS